MGARWQPLTALVLVALVAWFVSLRLTPPQPEGIDAPAGAFSGMWAWGVLERIAGDQSPHGVGTPANAAVRERIVAELERLGLQVELQETWVCGGSVCAPVVNIVAEIEGREPGPAILLASHYDSVHAGPGVGDDLHAVALSIEVARAIIGQGAPRRPVILLIDEGEEVGLLGAVAFVDEHPDAGRIGAVVNVEARGTGGMSAMFQTSDGNAPLVRAVLDHAPRPRATSLAVEVYRRMPNNTDLSIFLDRGMPGLNFAFIDGASRYHTPRDDLAHLDVGSLQHQGDQVLAAVTALADRDAPLTAAENLVYTDVLGLFAVAWAESWAVPIAALLAIAIVGLAVVARRRGGVRGPRTLLGAAATLSIVLLVVATAFGLTATVAALQGEDVAAVADPAPLRMALWAASALVALSVAVWLSRWAEPLELAFGVWIVWAAVGLAVAATVPGASIVFALPMLVGAAGLALAVFAPARAATGLLGGAAAMAVVWTDLAFGLEDAFGISQGPAVGAPLGVLFSVFAPNLVTDRIGWMRIGGALLGITVASAGWAAAIDVHDPDHPRGVAITRYEDRDSGEAWDVLVTPGHPGDALLAAAAFDPPRKVLPWLGWSLYAARAEPSSEPPPALSEGRFVSARGSDRAVLIFAPDSVQAVAVEGRPVAQETGRPLRLHLFGIPRQGVALRIRGGVPGTTVTLIDCSADLPPATRGLVDSRPADATTFQWGDTFCIKITATLPSGP